MCCKLAITTMSLGYGSAGHSLSHRLDMLQKYRYGAIELFYPDLVQIAETLPGGATPENEVTAAGIIRGMCQSRHLQILALQPFANFEGLLDRDEHGRRISEMKHWLRLVSELGTDTVAISSSFLPASHLSISRNQAVEDLREVADLGLNVHPPVRFVYEALCWGTRCDTWDESWDVVRAVDRPNFGLCLDTYNMAGRVYADPTAVNGITSDAKATMCLSLTKLATEVDIHKIFYIQVVDAAKLDAPLQPGHAYYNPEQPPRMSWSRNCRVFYGEQDMGGYLPIADILTVIFNKLGWSGWVSMELFNKRLHDRDGDVPREMARRGATSFTKMVRDFGLITKE